jgi:phosphoribosylformimino-5-aminoimidazole carboxamide ribotide isomerase
LKTIPVIDVLNGVTVHAVRGKRKEYLPLKTVLIDSIDPVEVAAAFQKLGFCELYVADLDAILGKKPNLTLYSQIYNQTGLKLMVDAGVTDIQTAKDLLASGVSKVIIGTETLQNIDFIKQVIQQLNAKNIVVSLDMNNCKVLTLHTFEGPTDPLKLLYEFRALGVSEFILLDLARVGSGEGVNTEFLKKALTTLKRGVYVGGGVRNVEDLMEIKALAVSGVLLATALHTGKIAVKDLKKAGLL